MAKQFLTSFIFISSLTAMQNGNFMITPSHDNRVAVSYFEFVSIRNKVEKLRLENVSLFIKFLEMAKTKRQIPSPHSIDILMNTYDLLSVVYIPCLSERMIDLSDEVANITLSRTNSRRAFL